MKKYSHGTLGYAPSPKCFHFRKALLAVALALTVPGSSRGQDASLAVGGWDLESTSRNLPLTVNNVVNIGDVTFDFGAGSLRITVNVTSSGYSVAKHYLLPMQWNQAPVNTWLKVLPVVSTGPYINNDFDLEVSLVQGKMSLRLRTTASDGVHPGGADITMECTGVTMITFSSTVAAAAVPTKLFPGNALTQIGGSVGIGGAPSSDAVLDLNGGDTKGLRIRPRSTAGAPVSGTWNLGTMIMDSTATLYVCTVAGTPGSWKKVGAP